MHTSVFSAGLLNGPCSCCLSKVNKGLGALRWKVQKVLGGLFGKVKKVFWAPGWKVRKVLGALFAKAGKLRWASWGKPGKAWVLVLSFEGAEGPRVPPGE